MTRPANRGRRGHRRAVDVLCSVVIATVGRQKLARAVRSVLDQAFPNEAFEVIVVNDSGQALPDDDWQRSPAVRVVATQHRERSAARNAGAALARGCYLLFLDDDDWLAPDALPTLWQVAQQSSADWVYGGAQLVDRSERALIQLRHTLRGNCFVQAMAGEWVPLQASLVSTERFFAVGGFNPLISGPEDVDLFRRISLCGSVAGTSAVVAFIEFGAEGSTTPHERHAAYSRWARERILDQPGAFARMRASATSSFWQGRIVRAYWTSAVWNMMHRRLFAALSRGLFGGVALALAGPHILSPRLWRALVRRYDSETFQRALAETRRFA